MSTLRVPLVGVDVDGSPLPAPVGRTLGSVRVRREASSPAACALTFTDPPADADAILAPAASLRVSADASVLFTGEIVTVEHTYAADGVHRVSVRGQDVTHRLRQRAQCRALVDVSVTDVVRDLADAVGLSVEPSAGGDGPRWPRIIADGRSGLDLLTTLTRRAGLWWQVDPDGARLRLFGADGAGDAVSVRPGAELLEAVLEVTAVGVHDGWRVLGWDPVTGQVHDSGSSGSDSDDSAGVRAGLLAAGPDHTDGLVTALTGDDAGRARTLRGVLAGDSTLAPGVGPGTRLTVGGVAASVAGDYVVLAADHVVDGRAGYTCTATSAPPEHLRVRGSGSWLGAAPGGPADTRPATTIGEVGRIDDPDGRGRVRVRLPAYDGLETEWLPVLALGAGDDKGLTVQPDVGDTVLVAHDPADPGRGVVLGGLRTNAGSEPACGAGSDGVGVYAMRLPGGQSLRMAADGDVIALANTTGSRIELNEDGVVVHSVGDLVLEAPGRGLHLKAARIDLERG